jgi:hypothetical protein
VSVVYTSFEITNFRCFEHLKVTDLARVNLIAGRNNSGKTALLEALYLCGMAEDPSGIGGLNWARGISPRPEDAGADVVWGTLFAGFDTTKTIQLSLQKREAPGRTVTITEAADPGLVSRAAEVAASDGVQFEPRALVLELAGTDGRTAQARTQALSRGLSRHARLPNGLRPWYLTLRGCMDPRPDSERFSELARDKRTAEVVVALQSVEPRLHDLQNLTFAGASVVHADIGLARLVPLSVMGDGMGRLCSIVLGLASTTGGTVLIDEIENGFHYSILRDVWRVIGDAARRFDVQVFATTHSLECIRAAQEAFAEADPEGFRYLRLQRLEDRTLSVVYDQESLESSLEFGLEVR